MRPPLPRAQPRWALLTLSVLALAVVVSMVLIVWAPWKESGPNRMPEPAVRRRLEPWAGREPWAGSYSWNDAQAYARWLNGQTG